MSAPVLIAGMHRSGTSFVAELLAAAGLDLGERLFPADRGNPRGYFEDEEFLSLQRSVLARACPADSPGWPDWGWTEAERLDPAVLDAATDAMADLLRRRAHLPCWGWKDPRTTLLLDRWVAIAPDLAVVGVVRAPWEVEASVRRLPNDLLGSPLVGVQIWMHYNRRLLEFAERHPAKTVVVSLDGLAAGPDRAIRGIARRLARPCLRLEAPVAAEIVAGRRADASPLGSSDPAAFAAQHPDAVALWVELQALARSTAPRWRSRRR